MSELSALRPAKLWRLFESICAIPHPSGHEQALSNWIRQWADERDLTHVTDEVGNIVIRKAATPGMEQCRPLALQAHLDMVPQKNNDTQHDFCNDPICPRIDGEWVKANGTTLGADNGIGMASALAVLDSDDVAHGPLEVLLTINEEAGMDGAFGLKPGLMQAELLINTDSEDEGDVYMGCAGGIDANLSFGIAHIAPSATADYYTLAISGLKGGHSGCDIHLGRGNANKLLARALLELSEFDLQLCSFSGGSLRNALPREASAVIAVEHSLHDKLLARIEQLDCLFKDELKSADPSVNLTLASAAPVDWVMARDSQRKLLAFISSCPNGVLRMSDEMTGVVETSSNLGVVTQQMGEVKIQCLIRSLRESGKAEAQQRISQLAQLADAKLTFAGNYPGWEPDTQSPLMQTVRETYQGLFGKIPNIMVIHAGLECGLFKNAYPDWDMVSFGPTIRFPHSPDEQVNIETVDKYWQLLVAVLAHTPRREN